MQDYKTLDGQQYILNPDDPKRDKRYKVCDHHVKRLEASWDDLRHLKLISKRIARKVPLTLWYTLCWAIIIYCSLIIDIIDFIFDVLGKAGRLLKELLRSIYKKL